MKIDNAKIIIDTFFHWRRDCKLSLRKCGVLLGVNFAMINRIENKKQKASKKILLNMTRMMLDLPCLFEQKNPR